MEADISLRMFPTFVPYVGMLNVGDRTSCLVLCLDLTSELSFDDLLYSICFEDLLISVALGERLSSPVGLMGLFSDIYGFDL